jgi:S-adenosylmethionine/arginine decarboxylase-like enzyme
MSTCEHQKKIDHSFIDKGGCTTPWGVSTCIDLYHCDPQLIRCASSIRRFVAELIELIEMRAYGPCRVVHFGQDARVAGFSMVQLIETSCITGHFANESNHAYLDLFSCKPYSVDKAAAFCQTFFKAASVRVQTHERH